MEKDQNCNKPQQFSSSSPVEHRHCWMFTEQTVSCCCFFNKSTLCSFLGTHFSQTHWNISISKLYWAQLNTIIVITCKRCSLLPYFQPLSSLSLCSTHTHTRSSRCAAGEPGRRFLMSLSVGSPGPHCHISLYYSCCSGHVQ